MSEGNGTKEDKEAGGIEFEPSWPQRPPRPQQARPHLDPPRGQTSSPQSRGSGGFGDTEIQPSKWTSHPTAYTRQPDMSASSGDPKETQVLPAIDTSRFDNGRPSPQDKARLPGPSQPASLPRRGDEPTSAPTLPYTPPQRSRARFDEAGEYNSYSGYDNNGYDGYDEGAPHAGRGRRNAAYLPEPGRVPVPPMGGRWPDPVPAYPAYADLAPAQKRKPKWRWLVWTFGGVLAIVAVVLIAFSLAWQGQYAGKIYPGVRALDIDLSGKTQGEAKKLLDDKVQAFLAQPVVLSWEGKDWRPSADQIGLKIDTGSTVAQAFALGRGGDFFGNAEQQWLSAQSGYRVPLDVQFSEPTLQTYLSTVVAAETNQKLFEGDVRLNGNEVVALPGKEGRTLDTYAAIAAVRNSLSALQPASKIELPVEVVPPTVSADEVAAVQSLLSVRVSSPLTATVPGRSFTLDRDTLVRFTTIERNPDRTAPKHVELGWKDNELKILADKWAKDSSRPPRNAKFEWKNGAVSVVSESIDGLDVDPAAVIASIKEHAATPDKREYELPARVVTPTVSSKDLGALGIKEQIGQGASTFKGSSPERATNIKVAAALLNGTVVPPGGMFSFLLAMGGIDEEHGFVPGYVIAAERTQLGVGGGVCQVSTTTFRAAFWSGMQIAERNQHSYRVGWYEENGEPVGFDAAVFDPGVDLKFVNNTSGYVLLEALTTADSLTVTMYGTRAPGDVKLEGPVISNRTPPPPDVYEVDSRLPSGTKKQVETARAGLDTLITRRIAVPGAPDKVDEFRSQYRAWPNWYIVASPSQIPGGASKPQATPTPQP